MKFLLYSDVGATAIKSRLGRPEYSYFFVLSGFRAALSELGEIVIIRDPEAEVDALYDDCVARGEDCVFLSFTPPYKTPITLRCPTICVLAWEFDTIPTETWDDEPRHDWRLVFAKLGRAICLSSYSARAVAATMGEDFQVAAIAAPVPVPPAARAPAPPEGVELRIRGTIVDSPKFGFRCDLLLPATRPPRVDPEDEEEIEPPELLDTDDVPFHPGLSDLLAPAGIDAAPVRPRPLRYRLGIARRDLVDWYREKFGAGLPPAAEPPAPAAPADEPPPVPEVQVQISGIVYTALFNPTDGRKNWWDLLTAFIYTFREVEDATLVLKIIHYDPSSYYDRLFVGLSQLAPFKCRVISLYGYLEPEEYEKLISVTDYCVTAARAEGLCLPLMEFMACGKPAVTPLHTAMEDYVDADCAFIVRSSREHNVWPQDPRAVYTTSYYRVDWESLCAQLCESYRVAKQEPERYRAMGAHAAERIRDFGSVETVRERLRGFFALPAAAPDRLDAPLLDQPVAVEAVAS